MAASSFYSTGVRIVVAGDRGTGKSSLIVAATAEDFPANVPPVLPRTKFPDEIFPDRVPVHVIDTSSSMGNRGRLADQLRSADVVILTFACDKPSTIDRLATFWIPELRRLEVGVPVILAGCKQDLRHEQDIVSLEEVISPIMQQFLEIEICMKCSAYNRIQVQEVFIYAQRAVLYPIAPLYDREARTLNPRCIRSLKRIFILLDHDRDGGLNDVDLNDLQVICFSSPLHNSEIVGVRRVVQENLPGGVNENGLTLTGFHFLHALFVERHRLDTTWTVLRKFGYNNDLRLSDDQLLPPITRTPDQSVELSSEALEFLRRVFTLFDFDGDGALSKNELEDLFSTAPENPWNEAPFSSALAEKNALGGLSLDGFLSLWALMILLDPIRGVESLIYIGYANDPSSAKHITRERHLDRKKKHSERNVFQCFVFGPKEAGKTSLLHSFVGSPFVEVYTPNSERRYAVNVVDQPGGIKKTLILREITEDTIEMLMAKKDAMAACDVAVFLYDSSNENSWVGATKLLVKVANLGKSTGYEVPCVIVAAKDDLRSYLTMIRDSMRVSLDIGIEAPIPISTKLGDLNNIFLRITRVAEHPHLSIPETETVNTRKHNHRLLNRSLTVVSVGAAVAVVGFAAYRVYATRRNAST